MLRVNSFVEVRLARIRYSIERSAGSVLNLTDPLFQYHLTVFIVLRYSFKIFHHRCFWSINFFFETVFQTWLKPKCFITLLSKIDYAFYSLIKVTQKLYLLLDTNIALRSIQGEDRSRYFHPASKKSSMYRLYVYWLIPFKCFEVRYNFVKDRFVAPLEHCVGCFDLKRTIW